jgi:FAD/FMN-containing dehydrogenase
MATEDGPDAAAGPTDPAADRRADYDYTGGDVDRPGLVADLERPVDGEVRFDEYTRTLYATDASAYEVTPVGVVFPTGTDDVAATVGYCHERGIPVLPRGGGTSLAGQAVNEAVVLDFTRHMDALHAVDPDGRTATAAPGILLGDLDAALAEYDLKFAPDPAWGDKSALGGAIGNNSTGSHSLEYGKTDAYIETLEVVLADGTVHRFGPVTLEEWRERADATDRVGRSYAALLEVVESAADAVEDAYPDLERNVSGYNLDRLLEEYRAVRAGERETVNLARALAGSEGTLGVVTEATVALEPVPDTKAMALLVYEDLLSALSDVEAVLPFEPAAVEVLDDVLLDLARDTAEFGDLVEATVPAGAGSVLLVEFYATDDADGRRQVADLLADRQPETATNVDPADPLRTGAPVRAVYAAEAHADADRERFWELRKSGLPILLGRTGDEKHVSFIEDTAVPPEHLPAFVAEFQAVLADEDTFASFYGHAGPGCLHVRPLVDTKSVDGVETMAAIAEEATDLVLEYDGSVSGEHGDGRARTQWNTDAVRRGDPRAVLRRQIGVRPGVAVEPRPGLWRRRDDRVAPVRTGLRVRRGLRAGAIVGHRKRHAGNGGAVSRLRRLPRPPGHHRRRDVSDLPRRRRGGSQHPRPGQCAPGRDERSPRRRGHRRRVPRGGAGALYRL